MSSPELQPGPARISIIIEWKNQDLATDQRADAMLEALSGQWLALTETSVGAIAADTARSHIGALSLQSALEMLFVYDSETARRNLEHQLSGRFDGQEDPFEVRMIDGTGFSYYSA